MSAPGNPGLTDDQVRHVASLARLALTDDEVTLFSTQLSEVLAYVENLRDVCTDGVEPLVHPFHHGNRLRDDATHDSLGADRAMANAPQTRDDFFATPAVLDRNAGV